jgi:transposase-like protein
MEHKRSRNRYSVAFKMQVADEVENGLLSIAEAVKLYAIPGKATVWEWVKQYGINAKLNKAVYVMSGNEEKELLRLRKENRRLQKALDDSQIKMLALESLIEVAEERFHLDLKKKYGEQVLAELRKKLSRLDTGGDSE